MVYIHPPASVYTAQSLVSRNDKGAVCLTGGARTAGPRASSHPTGTKTYESQPCPHLRREFDVSGEVSLAMLYITGLGVNRAEINGRCVSEDVLRPGWTSYKPRLCYQTYDVTPMLWPGANAIGIVLADGWARGNLGFRPKAKPVHGESRAPGPT
jgi:alpha-L-rhamnosidase